MSKVWEVTVLAILVCLAAKLISSTLQPFLPVIILSAIAIAVVGSLYHRSRRW